MQSSIFSRLNWSIVWWNRRVIAIQANNFFFPSPGTQFLQCYTRALNGFNSSGHHVDVSYDVNLQGSWLSKFANGIAQQLPVIDMSEEERPINQFVKNSNLSSMEEDELFHIGIKSKNGLQGLSCGDVKFVCMGGSTDRIRQFAKFLQKELSEYLGDENEDEPKNLSKTDRYVVYKVGPVLVVNHGIGIPSLSVIMNEIFKLLHHAGAQGVTFFRIGTSGGLGLKPGTVVLTKSSMNALLEPFHEQIILGKAVKFPATLDEDLRKDLMKCGEGTGIPMAEGHTMCTNDFYEGQGRLDGAFCEYTLQDKLDFLNKLHKAGVLNIEMESVCFAAMCNRAGVKAAVLCVTLLDRLQGDQVHHTREHEEFQLRPPRIVAAYIKKYLDLQTNPKCSYVTRHSNKRAKAM